MATATLVRRKKKYTVDDVREALEIVVAEDPNRRDPRTDDSLAPRYVYHGEPICLVAKVLQQLGFPHGVIAALDREPGPGDWRDVPRGGVQIALSRHPALKKIDKTAMQLLAYVQREQDRGRQWGVIAKDAFKRTRTLPFGRWAEQHDRRKKPWIFESTQPDASAVV